MQKKTTYILNVVFMVAILAISFYVMLKDQDMVAILAAVHQAKVWYVLASLICAILYLVLQSFSLKVILTSLGAPVRFAQCNKYSFVGFLFNAITPSASGGQPMQVVYMKQDGISIGASSLSLLFWTIIYKVALLIVEGIAYLVWPSFCNEHLGGYRWLFLVGILVNLVSIILYMIIVFSRNGAKNIAYAVTWICHKVRIVKRKDKIQNKLDQVLAHYQEGAVYIRSHWSVAGVVLLVTLVQRIVYFAVTWFIYLALGQSGYSMIEIILLQSFVSVCIDILPLPGGVGVNEGFFVTMFASVMGTGVACSAMMLSRGASFYALLVISILVTLGAQMQILKKKHDEIVEKKREKSNQKRNRFKT